MDFMDYYNSCESRYELGIGLELKEFLNESNEVKDYSFKWIQDELIVNVRYSGDYTKVFIYDMLSFVSYEYLCLMKKEERSSCDIYYIYTQMNEDTSGIKIQLKVYK